MQQGVGEVHSGAGEERQEVEADRLVVVEREGLEVVGVVGSLLVAEVRQEGEVEGFKSALHVGHVRRSLWRSGCCDVHRLEMGWLNSCSFGSDSLKILRLG